MVVAVAVLPTVCISTGEVLAAKLALRVRGRDTMPRHGECVCVANVAFPALNVTTPIWFESVEKSHVPVGVPLAVPTVAVKVTV